jgi:hypothetical protein
MMRGDFSNLSERKLMDYLIRLGYDIEQGEAGLQACPRFVCPLDRTSPTEEEGSTPFARLSHSPRSEAWKQASPEKDQGRGPFSRCIQPA